MTNREEALFQEIYEEYYEKVVSYIRARVGDNYTAEDIASDVFFKCYNNIDRYDPSKAAVSTWVFTITNNTLKNYYRDRKPHASIDEMEGFDVPYEDDFDEAIRLEEIRKYLDEALASLDETKRRIIDMRYYDEMKTADIAEELGLSNSNVRVILTRTLKQLNVSVQDNEILQLV